MGGIYGINMCTKCLRKTNELDRYNQCNSCAITRNQSNSSPSYKRLSYIDYTPWYETGWLWFWLIVFPIVGLYGLYKRYPNFLWYFFGLAIIIRLFQLLFEWIKSFF